MVANLGLKSKVSKLLSDSQKSGMILGGNFLPGTARKKRYQVVNFTRRGLDLGVIVKDQEDLIAVFDNSNTKLGHLLMECNISTDPIGGIRVDAYLGINVNLSPLGFFTSNRLSLGAVFLLAYGIAPDQLMEPHHVKHAFINMRGTVQNVSREQHALLSAEYKRLTEVRNYLTTDVLDTDEAGLERFERNVSILTQEFVKHRGICTGGLDLVDDYIVDHLLAREKFMLSGL